MGAGRQTDEGRQERRELIESLRVEPRIDPDERRGPGRPRGTGSGVASAEGAVENGRNGRFAATGRLTDRQRRFVRALVRNGGNQSAAAVAAGAPESRANSAAHEFLSKQQVRDAIRAERERYLSGSLANLGLQTLDALMRDESAPAGVRLKAATWTLEAAGHNRKENKDLEPSADKPLSECSLEELDTIIAGGVAALERERRVIDVSAPDANGADSDSDVMD